MSPDSRPRPSSTRLLPPSHSCNLQTAAASFLFTRRGYPQGMEAPLLPGRGEELKEQGLGVWTILASLIQTEQPPISRGGGRSREVRHLSQCGPANAWRGQSGSQTGPCILCSALSSRQSTFPSPARARPPCPPQQRLAGFSSGIVLHQLPQPPVLHNTARAQEKCQLYGSNSQTPTHTKSTLKNIKLFPSLNPKCHKTNCISAVYLEISQVLTAGTPECFGIGGAKDKLLCPLAGYTAAFDGNLMLYWAYFFIK